jgi:flagellar motor switch protein FliG
MTSHATLLNENDRTVALVIAYTPLHNGAEILTLLTPERQSEIVRRLAAFQSDEMPVWEEGVTCREVKTCCLCPRPGYTPCNPMVGIDLASRLLERLDETVWQTILDDISQGNPELADCIRQRMWLFEDIARMDDQDVATILKNVESSQWATALIGASKELCEKIFKNISKRAAKVLQEDMEDLGPQRVSDVEAAQREIVYIMNRLQDAGEVAR